jgi:hypothetical protein
LAAVRCSPAAPISLATEAQIPSSASEHYRPSPPATSLFGWLVADGWCWFVLREEYCWLVAGGWFVVREKYCWLVADKPSEQCEHHPDLVAGHGPRQRKKPSGG